MKGSAGQHLFYHALRPRKDPRRRASPPFVDAAHFLGCRSPGKPTAWRDAAGNRSGNPLALYWWLVTNTGPRRWNPRGNPSTSRYTPSVCRNTEVHTECLPLLNHWAKRWSGSYNKPADAVRSYW